MRDRIVLCAVCFVVVAIVFWVKSEANSREKLAVSPGGMPSMKELFSKSDWRHLRDTEVREPY